MARVVIHTFEGRTIDGEQPPAVQSRGGVRWIEISGGLSVTGSDGELEARLSRRYRTLTLQVVCRTEGREHERRLLDFAYRARVQDLEPGRYLLRVLHTVLASRASGKSDAISITVHEREIQVAESDDPSGADRHPDGARVVHRKPVSPRTGQQ